MSETRCDIDLIHTEDVRECKEKFSKINSELLLTQLKLIADERRFKIL